MKLLREIYTGPEQPTAELTKRPSRKEIEAAWTDGVLYRGVSIWDQYYERNDRFVTKALERENDAEPVDFIKEPNWADTEHSHDFDVYAFVVKGELTIEKKSGNVVCRAGDTVRYPAGELHTEKVGPNGVKALVGRRPAQM